MSIFDIDLETYVQNFNSTKENKELYGEVHTDFKLIHKMLNLIPRKYFKNPTLKWLDPCTGRGYFAMVLYKKLFSSLSKVFPEVHERHDHIISNMIYLIELNSDYIPLLKNMFGEKSHIYNEDFLQHSRKNYDFVIGNPPYNINGLIKVPTSLWDKHKEGKTVWQFFISKALSVLKPRGHINFITPSIWMKNDHPMYDDMIQYHIKKLHTLNNTETNKIFHGHAQTPICYFLIQNTENFNYPFDKKIILYDKIHKKYIKYNFSEHNSITNKPYSLPLFGVSIIQKLQRFIIKAGSCINVTKTNMRPGYKGLILESEFSEKTPYPNITTCVLDGLQPRLVINFSNIKCSFSGIPKLVLAHKMYGFPCLDYNGFYGISNRDNYVILNKTKQEFKKLQKFLSTNFIITLFEATRYRMKYLERYIFEMLPDITNLQDFPEDINDETLFDYFGLDELERNLINTFHKKRYLSF